MGVLQFVNIASCSEKYPYINKSGIMDDLSKESGRERVIRMYSKNHMGFISPELLYVLKSSSAVTILAGCYGALVHMKKTKEDFFRKNTASIYESQHLGRRALVDTMSLSAFKGIYKYGLQYGAFSTVYLLSTMTIENYRDKISIWEHMGTAAFLGAVSRWKYGPKGILVAGSLGAVLGSLAGGAIMLNMWLMGTDFQDFRYWHHEYYHTKILKKKIAATDV